MVRLAVEIAGSVADPDVVTAALTDAQGGGVMQQVAAVLATTDLPQEYLEIRGMPEGALEILHQLRDQP